MRYDRLELIARVEECRDRAADVAAQRLADAQAEYDDEVTRWRRDKQPETLTILRAAVEKVRKGRPLRAPDVAELRPYSGLIFHGGESRPTADDKAWFRLSPAYDHLLAHLRLVTDETVTTSALERAGFKQLERYTTYGTA